MLGPVAFQTMTQSLLRCLRPEHHRFFAMGIFGYWHQNLKIFSPSPVNAVYPDWWWTCHHKHHGNDSPLHCYYCWQSVTTSRPPSKTQLEAFQQSRYQCYYNRGEGPSFGKKCACLWCSVLYHPCAIIIENLEFGTSLLLFSFSFWHFLLSSCHNLD